MPNKKYEYYKNYRKTNLRQLTASIPAKIADPFREKLKKDGISFSKFLKNAIDKYMKGEK